MCLQKEVSIYFTDFWPDFNTHNNIFIDILQKKFIVTVSPENPDFLFCSDFGDKHYSYSCPKIFFSGENASPDFNKYDYAIAFDDISFADRYYRLPLFHLYLRPSDLAPQKITQAQWQQKTKFCNFIYSNSEYADPRRVNFFLKLSAYKHVDSGGGLLNNTGGRVKEKLPWQSDFRFSIAFENSLKPGYSTEKILQALQAGTIPIYWGNPCIDKDFNEKCFINCHAYTNFNEVIEAIKRLEGDEQACLNMLNEPWFSKPIVMPIDDINLHNFLFTICNQNKQSAKRTCNTGMASSIMEFQRACAYISPSIRYLIKAYRKYKRL